MSVDHVALQREDVDVGRAAADFEQDVGRELAVLLDDGDEEIGDLAPRVVAELAAATEVGEGHAAVGQREEVARVRVGVEEAVHEDLLVVADDALVRRRLAVDMGAVELVEPVERDADDSLLGQHGRGRAVPVDRREVDVGVIGERRAETLAVAGLVDVVALLVDCARELVDQADEVVLAPEVGAALNAPRLRAKDVEVGLDDLVDVGALHLHGHRRAVEHDCHVHLADARGRGRHLVELGVELLERLAERALDLAPYLLERERLHRVLQPRELLGERGGDEVGAHGEHLPDLGERRAEPLHRAAQSLLRREVRIGALGAVADAAPTIHGARIPSWSASVPNPSSSRTVTMRRYRSLRLMAGIYDLLGGARAGGRASRSRVYTRVYPRRAVERGGFSPAARDTILCRCHSQSGFRDELRCAPTAVRVFLRGRAQNAQSGKEPVPR